MSELTAGKQVRDQEPGPRMILAVVAAILVTVFYAVVGWNHALLYDDEQLILDEPRPRSMVEVASAFTEPHYGKLPYYRPLVRVTYLAQKAIHGDAERPYHLFNSALAGAILVALFVLFRQRSFAIARWPALLAAVWIVLHPVAASCVFPVAGRDTLIPTLFTLIAVAAWLRPGPVPYAIAVAAMAAAVLGKEQAIVVPVLFILADLAGLTQRPKTAGGWIVRHAPPVVVVGAYAMIRGAVLSGGRPELGIGENPFAPLAALAYGIQSSLAPFADLVYEPSFAAWYSLPRLALATLALAAMTRGALRFGPGPRGAVWFWFGWFLVAQLPTAGFFRQETSYDERYVFLALAGIGGIAATLLSGLLPKAPRRRAVFAVVAVVIALFGGVTLHRGRSYADSLSFHTQWVASNPGSAGGHNGLGVALARAGRTDEATGHYLESLRLRPSDPQTLCNLGLALWESGRATEAETRYRESLQQAPGHAEAHYNLANLLSSTGRAAEAQQHYLAALELRRGYAMAHNNYGALLVAQGRLDEARDQFEAAARARPDHARTHLNLGIVLGREGRLEEAAARYRHALAIDPGYPEAHFNLAAVSWALGNRDDAITHLQSALRQRPDWGEARRLLDEIENRPQDQP